MGHERLGVLPRTKCWVRIIEDLGAFDTGEAAIGDIARATLRNVDARFRQVHRDTGVQAAFSFLVALPLGARGGETAKTLLGIDLAVNPSSLTLAGSLKRWVSLNRCSMEHGGIAERAALDAIAFWLAQHGREGLFGPRPAREIWAEASTGAGFSELARSFFSGFTQRYLKYFLDRAASAEINTLEARERFELLLHNHVDDISKHAFEISAITQSFAAGWFSKRAPSDMPPDREIREFLSVAFGKIREEILREVDGP